MPRYFFDVRDRGRRVCDEIGVNLQDEANAICEASQIIWQLLQQAQAERRPGAVSVSIRTETGAWLYETSTCVSGD